MSTSFGTQDPIQPASNVGRNMVTTCSHFWTESQPFTIIVALASPTSAPYAEQNAWSAESFAHTRRIRIRWATTCRSSAAHQVPLRLSEKTAAYCSKIKNKSRTKEGHACRPTAAPPPPTALHLLPATTSSLATPSSHIPSANVALANHPPAECPTSRTLSAPVSSRLVRTVSFT